LDCPGAPHRRCRRAGFDVVITLLQCRELEALACGWMARLVGGRHGHGMECCKSHFPVRDKFHLQPLLTSAFSFFYLLLYSFPLSRLYLFANRQVRDKFHPSRAAPFLALVA
jgi:hypothetical protein